MDTPEVLVAGELFIDLIFSGFETWPQAGKEIFAREFHREIGGGAAITACGLAKLGTRAAVLGAVGVDSGQWLVDRLKGSKVETKWIRFDATETTALTVVATTPEDRAFLTYAGANRAFDPLLREAAHAKLFSGVRHVHLAYAPPIETAAELSRQLRDCGCTFSIDFGWREEWLANSRVLTILQNIDILFPNEIEARHLTGEEDTVKILQAFQANGVKRVALKLGARGGALLWDGDIVLADTHPVTPVDTTGAGDCFDAGFLHAWLGGHPPDMCLQIANICGALSTEAYGGITAFPTIERLNRELTKGQLCAK